MIERIEDNVDAIRDIMKADSKTKHLVPTWQDKDCWQALTKALSPVAALTDMLCGHKYVTVSSLNCLYWKLESTILANDIDDPDMRAATNDMRAAIMAELLEKAVGGEMIINISSFLDPRYKVNNSWK